MSIAGNSGPPRFTVGGVIATTFSVLFRNLVRFVAIILIVGVPVIGFFIGGAMLLSGELTSTGAGFDVRFSGASGFETLFVIASMLLMVLGYLLVLNALVHGTLESLSGRTVSIAGSLSAGLSALPRTFFASLLVIIVGVLIGFMVMMFMGLLLSVLMLSALLSLGLSLVALMVLARILVFVPAIVAERAGVLECFGRSQELTREHRWGLFGIMLLLTAVNWVIPFASAALAAISPEASNALDIAFAVFSMAFVAALMGAAFHLLRSGKEGAPVGEIAKVFD